MSLIGWTNKSITKSSLISEWGSLFQNHINLKWVSKWQVNNGFLMQLRTKITVWKVDSTCLASVKLLFSNFLTIELNKSENVSYIWFMMGKPLVTRDLKLQTLQVQNLNGNTMNLLQIRLLESSVTDKVVELYPSELTSEKLATNLHHWVNLCFNNLKSLCQNNLWN